MTTKTTRTEEDREFSAITEAEIFAEARDRLAICVEAESDNRSRGKAAISFREGDQWDHSTNTTASDDSPELTINLTDAMIERVENNIKQQRPRGKCHPVGEGADTEIAEILNGIGRHIETRSEASIAYDTAAASALDAGWGYFRLIAEYIDNRSFQKDLRILPIRNIFTVYMDPSAIMPHGSDQNWCLISVKMKREEYRRRYGSGMIDKWSDTGASDPNRDWGDKEDIRLAEYFRIREKTEKLYQLRGQNGEEFTKYRSELPRIPGSNKLMPIDDVTLMLGDRGLRIDGERDSSKHQVEWFRLNGTKVVERQEIPGIYIPVFRVEGKTKDIDGRIRRRGMVEAMMDPQRMVNYGEVAKIKRLGLAPKAPWVAAEGQLDGREDEWAEANQRPTTVLTYKPVIIETSSGPVVMPKPERQPPAQIEAGFSEFVQGMRSNLMAVAGMPNEPGQDARGEVVSGKAIARRQFLSDQSHYQYYDNLTLAIAQCWRCMVDWIPVYFSEERMQRVIGEDSTPRMVKINDSQPDEGDNAEKKIKNDLSVGKYDVVMDTGPGYETKREEGAENLLDLLKIEGLAEIVAKTGADLVFRSIDHPYMQELADRLVSSTPEGLKKVMEGLSSKAKAVVEYLAKENEALKQQLQTVQADLKYGITKAHLDATVKAHGIEESEKTKRSSDAMWVAQDTHEAEMKSHTALAVAEIHAGASLLNTHVEAAHNKDAAERVLQTADRAENQPQGE
jgi:hypothetical protein